MPTPLPAVRRLRSRTATAMAAFLVAGIVHAAPGEAVDPLKSAADPAQVADPVAVVPVDATSERAGFLRKVHDRASSMVVSAMNFVGVRYQRGGVSAETGFDCSGFTRHVFEMSLGLVLPRRADEQAAAPGLVAVKREDLRPGDLVFFNTLKRTFSHVGIYIGDNRFIHSPRPGESVRTENMGFAYWASRFTGARRAQSAAAPVPAASSPSLAGE